MTVVVQMHGEPGSGKSTLARALAPRIGVVVLDKDIIKSALLHSGIAEHAAGPTAYEVYFNLAASLLGQGQAVILDNPVYWVDVERRWQQLACAAGSPLLLIHCVCPDRSELERRLVSRNGMASQPRTPLVLSDHPDAVEARHYPRLVLDTSRPLDELVEEATAYVHMGALA